MAKKNFYAVKGADGSTALYTNWPECQKAVKGVKGVLYKGFATKAEAEAYITPSEEAISSDDVFAYVDGSFSPKFAHGGWGVVIVQHDTELYRIHGRTEGDALSRNIDGEVMAAMHAITWSHTNKTPLVICHDYTGVRHWALKEWKASSEIAKLYQAFCEGKLTGIQFKKVDAHSGDKWNDVADALAKKGCGIE